MRINGTVHVAVLLLALATSALAIAGTLPALISFDGDTIGATPSLGGPNQPSALEQNGVSIRVESSAFGITTKPVVLRGTAWYDYGSVVYTFPNTQKLRVEATFSADRLFDGYILETAVPLAILTRLILLSDGNVYAESQSGTNRPLLGRYAPNQPFRVRIDIDVVTQTWAFTLDGEMNGFADNPTIQGLRFVNSPQVIPSVGSVYASLNIFPTAQSALGAAVAYDDIYVQDLNLPPLVPSAPIPTISLTALSLLAASVGLAGVGAFRRRNDHRHSTVL
jgi:hypothetical protein